MNFCTAIMAFSTLPAVLLAQQTAMPKAPVDAPPAVALAAPADPNKVVLTVGDTKLTVAQYNALIAALPANVQAYANGPSKRQFVDNLIPLFVLSQSAEKLNLDREQKVQDQIKFQRQNILAGAMVENIQKNVKVDDAAVQAYYDAHKDQYESLKGKHILIRVKGAPMPAPEGKPELEDAQALAKAQDIRKKLVAGGDFTALAKAESDDTVSGAQGGDLGEFKRGMMVPPFEQAAFALKIGEISEPVKSPFGYHIIVVTEHKSKSLADVRPEIEQALRPEIARKEVEALRAKANVQVDDSFFGPATPAAPPVLNK